MSTQILVKNGKIYANILKNSEFSQIVTFFKQNKLRFDGDGTRYWEIPRSKYDEVIDGLEDIDTIIVSEDTAYEIDQLLKPTIAIEQTGITFEESELKGTFKLGKAPFENYQEEDIRRALSHNAFGLLWDMGCIAEGTEIVGIVNGSLRRLPIEKYYAMQSSSKSPTCGKVWSKLKDYFGLNDALAVLYSGKKECIRLTFQSGKILELTPDHEVLTIEDFKQAQHLTTHDFVIGTTGIETLKSISSVGIKNTYDIAMNGPYHNFVANGIVVHNCGKSFATSSIFHILKKRRKASKMLILTSASGVGNIAKELVKFSSVTEEEIAIGDKYNRRPFDDMSKNIIICNYRSFLLISDEYQKLKDKTVKKYRSTPIPIEAWLDNEDGYMLLDESHHIANHSSRIAHVVHLIAPYFKYRNIMTGTPADKEEKYYSQLKFLDPTLVHNMNFTDWSAYYCNVGTRFSPYAIESFKPEKLRELVHIVKKYTVYRDSAKVLELPENVIHKTYVYFSPKLKTIYQEFITEKLKYIQLKKNGTLPMHEVTNFFQKMIISIDNPSMLKEDTTLPPPLLKTIKSFDFLKDHPKIEALEDIFERHSSEKIIVWTSHPSVGEILHNHFKESFVINGETEVPKGLTRDGLKDKIVDDFKKSKSKRVLFAGLQVLNTAVTIVEATVNVYFDVSFDHTHFSQSMKRIHRIGQNNTCHTYILLIDESLDVTRYEMLEDKDFTTKNFGNDTYLSIKTANNIFTRKGSL